MLSTFFMAIAHLGWAAMQRGCAGYPHSVSADAPSGDRSYNRAVGFLPHFKVQGILCFLFPTWWNDKIIWPIYLVICSLSHTDWLVFFLQKLNQAVLSENKDKFLVSSSKQLHPWLPRFWWPITLAHFLLQFKVSIAIFSEKYVRFSGLK